MRQIISVRRHLIIFALILATGAIVRFWNIQNLEVQSDLAINSFRALGWFDYLSDEGQTTPVNWYSEIPWWANLSFHDHPPLVFAIQRAFFLIFSDSPFAVHAPFALAGTLTIALIFTAVKHLRSSNEALVAALMFAVSSYAVWASRAGFLEGVQEFFVAASFFSFALYAAKRQKKYLLWWGFATGFALLCKYTSFFLLPPVAIYTLAWERALLRTRSWWISLGIIVALLSPVIVYNAYMFSERGHFDASLSSMLGIASNDFSNFNDRATSFNISRIPGLALTIAQSSSLPFELMLAGAVILALYLAITRKLDSYTALLALNIASLALMFTFLSPDARFVSIILPFCAAVTAQGLIFFWEKIGRIRAAQHVLTAIAALAILSELLFAINTNLTKKPIGNSPTFYASNRFYSLGFLELDQYLRDNVYKKLPPRANPRKPDDLVFEGRNVVLVDERLSWFSMLWHLRRYMYYYGLPVVLFTDFAVIETDNVRVAEIEFLRSLGAFDIYFVYAPETRHRIDIVEEYDERVESLAEKIRSSHAMPIQFNDFDGRDSIYLYRIPAGTSVP